METALNNNRSSQTNLPHHAGNFDRTNTANSKESGLVQLVCFKLSQEDFGVDIHRVQEINRRVTVTRIPQSAAFVEGVIDLRGKIVPVIDLRRRFGFPVITEQSKESRIVVVETSKMTVGMIVDEVTEVLRLPTDSIKPTPELAQSDVEHQYILGVTNFPVARDEATGKTERLLIVLDMDQVFSKEEAKTLRELSEELKS